MNQFCLASVSAFLFLLHPFAGNTQELNPGFEIGVSASGFTYQGELSDSQFGNLKDTRYGFGLFLKYNITPVFSVRANYYYGKLRGDDTEFSAEWRQKRAYRFRSPLDEVSLMVEADLMGRSRFRSFRLDGKHGRRWSVSLLAGVGIARVNAERNWTGLDRDWFGKDATERIPLDSASAPDRRVVVLPAGFVVRYDLSKLISVTGGAAYRTTFTDNMDGYRHAVYSPRFDGYAVYSLGICYRFHSKRWYKPMF